MDAWKKFAVKQVYHLEDDVLDFLIYKDINDSGKPQCIIHLALTLEPLLLINVQTGPYVL